MNECSKYQELISCLIDGEITDDDRSGLYAHIESCPSCKAYLEMITLISGESELSEPPAELAQNVMISVHKAAASKKRKVFISRIVAAAACLAVILVSVPQLSARFGGGGFGASSSGGSAAPSGSNDSSSPSSAYDADGFMYAGGGDAAAQNDSMSMEAAEDNSLSQYHAELPTEDGDGAPPKKSAEDMGDSATAADPTFPEPEAPADVPDSAAGAGLRDMSEYAAVLSLKGELPDLISGYEKHNNLDGTYDIVVSYSLLPELLDLGAVTVSENNTGSGEILIIYTPEQ